MYFFECISVLLSSEELNIYFEMAKYKSAALTFLLHLLLVVGEPVDYRSSWIQSSSPQIHGIPSDYKVEYELPPSNTEPLKFEIAQKPTHINCHHHAEPVYITPSTPPPTIAPPPPPPPPPPSPLPFRIEVLEPSNYIPASKPKQDCVETPLAPPSPPHFPSSSTEAPLPPPPPPPPVPSLLPLSQYGPVFRPQSSTPPPPPSPTPSQPPSPLLSLPQPPPPPAFIPEGNNCDYNRGEVIIQQAPFYPPLPALPSPAPLPANDEGTPISADQYVPPPPPPPPIPSPQPLPPQFVSFPSPSPPSPPSPPQSIEISYPPPPPPPPFPSPQPLRAQITNFPSPSSPPPPSPPSQSFPSPQPLPTQINSFPTPSPSPAQPTEINYPPPPPPPPFPAPQPLLAQPSPLPQIPQSSDCVVDGQSQSPVFGPFVSANSPYPYPYPAIQNGIPFGAIFSKA